MSTLYRYFLIIIACTAILFGIQIPSFVDQYEKRLDAHFIEVQNNLRGFQEIADRFHGGSLEALIEKHEKSNDATFQGEAEPIRNMYRRFLKFKAEKAALATSLPKKLAFIAVQGDKELVNETRRSYSYTIPLNQSAVISGVVAAASVILIFELLRIIFAVLARPRAPKFKRNRARV